MKEKSMLKTALQEVRKRYPGWILETDLFRFNIPRYDGNFAPPTDEEIKQKGDSVKEA